IGRVRANPPPADAAALAGRLRARKLDLQRLRAEAAGRARAELAAGGGSPGASAVDRVRSLDRDLAATEDALDRVYDLLRPGADRQADRRTRAACLEVGRTRLQAVRDALVASGVPDANRRVRLLKP